MQYTFLLESAVQPGDLIVYWGFAHFFCNFERPDFPGKEFIVLYAKSQTAMDIESKALRDDLLILGISACWKFKGDSILYDPFHNSVDVVIMTSEWKAEIAKIELPPNVVISDNEGCGICPKCNYLAYFPICTNCGERIGQGL